MINFVPLCIHATNSFHSQRIKQYYKRYKCTTLAVIDVLGKPPRNMLFAGLASFVLCEYLGLYGNEVEILP